MGKTARRVVEISKNLLQRKLNANPHLLVSFPHRFTNEQTVLFNNFLTNVSL